MARLLLVAALASAAAHSQPAAFETASVRPSPAKDPRRADIRFLPGGGLSIVGIPLYMIVAIAHQGQTERFTGGPLWVRSLRFDIQAKAAAGTMDGLSAAARLARTRSMLQALLAERFGLTVRREAREVPVYVLTVAKGPKLKRASVDDTCHQLTGGQGRGLHGKAVDIADIAGYLENWTDRPVVKGAHLDGLFATDTAPWGSMFTPGGAAPAPPPPELGTASVNDPVRPSLFTVLARVGLKLEAGRAKVDVFVIEHIQQPSPN
jgi:uncharacterized protein (TIGR03435 family)